MYEQAVMGVPAKKICLVVKRDKAHVSRILKALVELGFIYCINQSERVHIYEATKKPFPSDDVVILSTISRRMRGKAAYKGYSMRCHGLFFKADVVSWGRELKWDKEWETKGSHHSFFVYPVRNLGSVSFHRVTSRYSDVLRVNLPNIHWSVEREYPVEKYIGNIARKVYSWFCREYSVSILNIQKCEGDSAGLPVHDLEMVSLAQKRSVKFDDGFMLDASPPENRPEFEGPVGKMAELISCPSRIDVLEKRVEGLVASIERLAVTVDKLVGLFDAPRLPDEKRDVT